MVEKIYNQGMGKELFEDTWKYGTKKQKENFLVSAGVHKSFAVTKTPDEMVARGGGMGVRQAGRIFDKYLEKNKKIKINWA